jgi:cysteine desulfurase
MIKPVYLDYMSTTPVDQKVIQTMQNYLGIDDVFGNPSSKSHSYGAAALMAVQTAREQVAHLIGAEPREIIWTSGATEANNLAILGAARFHQRSGRHIITVKTEHKAVLDSCLALQSEGFEVTFLDVDHTGRLDLSELEKAIRADTILISVMHLNNETGVVQDVEAIASLARERGVLCHVDAAQSAGKIPLNVKQLKVDLLSLSAHKIYGPKGIGALYVCRQPRVRLQPLLYGGGQEWGMRSGTLATHQIVGMGQAFELALASQASDQNQINLLSDMLQQQLLVQPGVTLNGRSEHHYSGCLNMHIDGVEADTLIASCPELAFSKGSACDSAGAEVSHALLAMGLKRAQVIQCVRLSLGRMTTVDQVEKAASVLIRAIGLLRQ